MAVIVAVVFILVILRGCDYICFMRRIDEFERKASEFSDMYKTLAPKVAHGDPEIPDVDLFSFEGECFLLTVEKEDWKSFYSQLTLALCEVFDSYDRIGERYLSSMDEETSKHIEDLYVTVKEINGQIRYQKWIRGIK